DKHTVYQTHYAHERMCSIFGKAGVDLGSIEPGQADLTLLALDPERELVKQLAGLPDTIMRAAEHASPHMLCDYLEQTAGAANSWYHAGNPTRNPEWAVLVDDPAVRGARLALARAVQIVLRNGLALLGIDAPRRMTREDSDPSDEE
ncbi:MAG: arginine--tRNA ligase, partial [Gemmatimonadetes bacterium]|nr:arginine--tRNA ligase [Gemmatimonadota bacterium]